MQQFDVMFSKNGLIDKETVLFVYTKADAVDYIRARHGLTVQIISATRFNGYKAY
jgi:hypothetical protein